MSGYSEHYPPVIVDIEASGMGVFSYPIEIGYYASADDYFCCLIQPDPEWHTWSYEAQHLHGISRDQLLDNGLPPAQIATTLNQRLNGRTVFSDGWVVDMPWLRRLFFAARIQPQFRLSSLECIMTEEMVSIWDATKQEVIRELGIERHRASSDARVIQQTWISCQQIINGSKGDKRLIC